MRVDLERVAAASAKECLRQGVGIDRLAFLLNGYAYAVRNADLLPREEDLLQLAGLVEPSTGGRYRTTPVAFREGGSAAGAGAVPGAVARLFAVLDRGVAPEEFVHHLLEIHPFSDGNGRVGFVLINWLAGTLAIPQPLPDWCR